MNTHTRGSRGRVRGLLAATVAVLTGGTLLVSVADPPRDVPSPFSLVARMGEYAQEYGQAVGTHGNLGPRSTVTQGRETLDRCLQSWDAHYQAIWVNPYTESGLGYACMMYHTRIGARQIYRRDQGFEGQGADIGLKDLVCGYVASLADAASGNAVFGVGALAGWACDMFFRQTPRVDTTTALNATVDLGARCFATTHDYSVFEDGSRLASLPDRLQEHSAASVSSSGWCLDSTATYRTHRWATNRPYETDVTGYAVGVTDSGFVFGRGVDGSLVWRDTRGTIGSGSFAPVTVWPAWQRPPQPFPDTPIATVDVNGGNEIHLFYESATGGLWHVWGNWRGWYGAPLDTAGYAQRSITAVSRSDGVHVFYTAADRRIHHARLVGGHTAEATVVTNTSGGQPTVCDPAARVAAVTASDAIHLFACTGYGDFSHLSLPAGSPTWAGPTSGANELDSDARRSAQLHRTALKTGGLAARAFDSRVYAAYQSTDGSVVVRAYRPTGTGTLQPDLDPGQTRIFSGRCFEKKGETEAPDDYGKRAELTQWHMPRPCDATQPNEIDLTLSGAWKEEGLGIEGLADFDARDGQGRTDDLAMTAQDGRIYVGFGHAAGGLGLLVFDPSNGNLTGGYGGWFLEHHASYVVGNGRHIGLVPHAGGSPLIVASLYNPTLAEQGGYESLLAFSCSSGCGGTGS